MDRDKPIYKGVDYTNKQIGKYLVLSRRPENNQHKSGSGLIVWKVKCISCGQIFEKGAYKVINNINGCSSCALKNSKVNSEHHGWTGGKYVSGSYLKKIQRRSIIKNIDFNLSITYLDDLWEKQNGKCAYSGICLTIGGRKMKQTASIDRIDSKLGYVEGNVQFVHKDVNQMKMDLSEDVFLNFVELIFRNRIDNE